MVKYPVILTQRLELRTPKHSYVYDPTKFKTDFYDRSPVFRVDRSVISVDQSLAIANEGVAYLVCGCSNYEDREKRFDDTKPTNVGKKKIQILDGMR